MNVFVAVVSTANAQQRIKPETRQVQDCSNQALFLANLTVFIRCCALAVLISAIKFPSQLSKITIITRS